MHFDIIVIGAGIAGTSVAAELSGTHRVLLIEAEAQPGFHSTGRSAAIFSEMYGNPLIRALSRSSRTAFVNPSQDFADGAFISQRRALFIAREDQLASLEAFASAPDIAKHTRRLDKAEILSNCPVLRPEYVAGGVLEAGASDIDVHGLHQAYLRQFKSRGGTFLASSRVDRVERGQKGWEVGAGNARFSSDIIVNAAGAWADLVGRLANAQAIGLQPCRRTALLVEAPAGLAIGDWPMVIDVDEQFYFKPDAGLVLLSPADETPTDAEDAQPDEWDIAVAIDRVTTATTIDIRHVKHKWAGLRSFVPDRTPVAGFDPIQPGFFWLAGQGGYGVQTAPALARLSAALVRGEDVPEDIAAQGVKASELAAGR